MVFTIASIFTFLPSISQVVLGISTVVISVLVKEKVNDVCEGKQSQQSFDAISNNGFSNSSVDLEDKYFIDNDAVMKKLSRVFSEKPYCVLVVGAPIGCGKSTYVRKAMRLASLKSPERRLYYFSGLVNLYEQWKLPMTVRLSSILPRDAVLIFDQVDDREITSSQQNWIVNLATQARNSAKFHVVVVVAYPDVMRTILHLNGGQKIMSAFSSRAFWWNDEMMGQLIQCLLPNVTETYRCQLAKCLTESRSPQLIHLIAERISESQIASYSTLSKLVKRINGDYLRGWRQFLSVSEINFNVYDSEDSEDDSEDSEDSPNHFAL